MLGLLQKRQLRRRRFRFGLKLGGKGKFWRVFLLVCVLGIIFGYFFIYRPYTKIKSKAQEVVAAGKQAKVAFASNDIVQVKKELDNVKVKFNDFKKEGQQVYWMRYIPLGGAYVSDFKNGVEAGEYLIDAAQRAIIAIEPHADLIGFKKGDDASFIEKPAELRLQTAVLTLDKIVEDVDSIAEDVDKARENISKINPNRYPKKIGNREIRSTLQTGKDQFEGIASLFVDAKPFIKSLPDILGARDDKTYLILFMNDKELRASGGFITAYAVFDVKKGKFDVQKSDDIYTLDNSISSHPKAPREISQYHKNVNKFYIRDSNLSPDYVESVKLFEELYAKSNQKVEYDGIIAVDTYVLVNALKVLGDTEVRGINFSAQIDERCDCPGAIYKLLDEIDRPVAYLKEDRKGILGDLLFALMQKALGFSPSKYWGKLSQQLIKDMQEKHVLIYMKDKDIQKSLEAMNFAGRIKDYEGDYLHINDVNFAGAKSNLFVNHGITSTTDIKNDGTVERTIVIEYKNPYPHSNCNLEDGGGLGRGGLCINATLRNWFRMYVPEGSELIEFKGSEKKVQTYDELGKTVFEGFFGVAPKGKSTVTVTYRLPFKVEDEKDYKLFIQKQPGTAGHNYTVIINGKKAGELPLTTDKKFAL
ncbi:hypothetical protein A3H80_00100 [Candidatus Roizmanbacteria bacterium RIFCSPLOWO2_02_FULL_37_19]|uniref:DUF4012 domain-containing protein n=1 Tax=Candidatus Roizmanbacteria bacterium RIFCSPHIGHO2_02_FULL_37_24 TaxID=1802037 RepID=A0A1F7GV08_9BACT|nr:MAG: hypothetical protein A3C24_04585 [Candidatus Roizmanbacteria bacterium RIFCSPHIGHO2_02_FULL_37_24]OGK33335.1 MAG: hypothetical protein A3E10_03135 [Candidatus Roizmanbacteria bacterium RIFCSPHIGHO2_12_FULL_37_23]OGK53927.1 MAG: hypothetical protein A3H80_00100 [Candidatus Roizmanbacteria bacterium RIFCSPLOWO2_02_FULL_37_19]OGK61835.1 MAG: hypothetical protein A3G65_04215 [Candidatus Roizmanbacteria bacterium RIFCSPLOWO2_12_FULL_37_7b]